MSEALQFKSVPHAVAWADEWLSKGNVESQIGRLLRPPGMDAMTADEVKWLAQRISQVVQHTKPMDGGLALRCIYGQPGSDGISHLSGVLASRVILADQSMRRRLKRVEYLAMGIIAAMRRLEYSGKTTNQSKLAAFIGISRQSFTKNGWPEAQAEIRQGLDDLLEIGTRAVGSVLDEQGLLREVGEVGRKRA